MGTGPAPRVIGLPHAEATQRLEMLIRAHDPCISCATHFLDLRIVGRGTADDAAPGAGRPGPPGAVCDAPAD